MQASNSAATQGTDLQEKARYELKYLISYFEYVVLRNRLKYVLQPDSHSLDENGYSVRSLYFDDLDNSDMFAKQAGLLDRKKIRIRIYNNSERLIRLEKKSRFNNMIKKEAIKITRHEYESIALNDVDFLRHAGTPTALMFYSEFKRGLLQPRVLVDYTREAYTLPLAGIRVTFDKMLRAGTRTDLFDAGQLLLRAMEPNMIIMEIKFDLFFPDHISSLLQVVSRGKMALSKYVMCRELNPSWF